MTVSPDLEGFVVRGRRNPALADWRTFLTSTEQIELDSLEKKSVELRERRKVLSAAIRAIRDRCQTRRYEAAQRERRAQAAK